MGLVMYHRPSRLRCVVTRASVWPVVSLKSMCPLPFLLPLWLNSCIDGLSHMHLSGERMVPVDVGVNRAIVCRISLESVIILITPVPMAVKRLVLLSLLSYVVTGIGCGKVRYSQSMLRLLVALQLAPVSP